MAKMEIWESKFVDHVVDATPCTDSDALGLDNNITSDPRPPWPRRSRSRDFTSGSLCSSPALPFGHPSVTYSPCELVSKCFLPHDLTHIACAIANLLHHHDSHS